MPILDFWKRNAINRMLAVDEYIYNIYILYNYILYIYIYTVYKKIKCFFVG